MTGRAGLSAGRSGAVPVETERDPHLPAIVIDLCDNYIHDINAEPHLHQACNDVF